MSAPRPFRGPRKSDQWWWMIYCTCYSTSLVWNLHLECVLTILNTFHSQHWIEINQIWLRFLVDVYPSDWRNNQCPFNDTWQGSPLWELALTVPSQSNVGFSLVMEKFRWALYVESTSIRWAVVIMEEPHCLLRMSVTRLSAGVDDCPCFTTFYCYDPYWL